MLLLDECIPAAVCEALQLLQVQSTDIRREGLQESSDDHLVGVAKRLGAIFVTYDLDFTNRAIFAAMAREGICVVLIRVKEHSLAVTAEIILRHARRWPEMCKGQATIVSCDVNGCRAKAVKDLPFVEGP